MGKINPEHSDLALEKTVESGIIENHDGTRETEHNTYTWWFQGILEKKEVKTCSKGDIPSDSDYTYHVRHVLKSGGMSEDTQTWDYKYVHDADHNRLYYN